MNGKAHLKTNYRQARSKAKKILSNHQYESILEEEGEEGSMADFKNEVDSLPSSEGTLSISSEQDIF